MAESVFTERWNSMKKNGEDYLQESLSTSTSLFTLALWLSKLTLRKGILLSRSRWDQVMTTVTAIIQPLKVPFSISATSIRSNYTTNKQIK